MANFIRPDPAPLPPATTSVAPVVTRPGDTPPGVMPQPPVTTSSTLTPMATTAVVVTTAITLVTTTASAIATTAVPPVTTTMVFTVVGDAMRVPNVGSNIPTNIPP